MAHPGFQRGIRFQSVVECLDFLPPDERIIAGVLRDLVLAGLPGRCREKLTYNVPFYYGKRRICFIWPGSVPWGGFREGVMLGFCQGNRLADPHRFLTHGDNKQVYYRIYRDTDEIDEARIDGMLKEALRVDALFR